MCIPGMDVNTGCTVSVHPVWRICPCLHCERPLCHPGVVLIMRNPDDASTNFPSIPGVLTLTFKMAAESRGGRVFAASFY